MDIACAKQNMITQQLRTCQINNESIITTIKRISREFFVPSAYYNLAYADTYIPLEYDQIMMTPLEEAQLLAALNPQPQDKALEIGTGTGYLTCLLACLAKQVDSIDIFPDFTKRAREKLDEMQIYNTHLITDNAAAGWPNGGSYDVIAITGALTTLPNAFKEQLNIGGRIFAILGAGPALQATLIKRIDEHRWQEQHLFETWLPYLLHAPKPSQFSF